MYLKRKIDEFLKQWKNDPDRKPLIIKGSRQVGKTESVRHFASINYSSLIEINFVEEPYYRSITESGYKVDNIIKAISFIDPSKRFIEGNTLIFFDEIQNFPDIATSLKFFKQDGRFDVICSGSLLGINYNQIESNSVGYKTDYEMNSFDFEEFLWANGRFDDKENILSHMHSLTPFTQLELDIYNDLFLSFSILGGMPEVVRNYIERKTFEGSLENQKQILLDYKEDIKKYTNGTEQSRILNVFNSITPQLAKENKKFQISKVAKGAKSKDYWGCVTWLEQSGIIRLCHNLNFPELPLKGNYDEEVFKIYFSDVGILIATLDDEAQEDLRANRNLGVYKGAIFENIVADAFIKEGYDLFYYKRQDSTLEEDFFIRGKSHLIPVEVKAANSKSKSLSTLIKSEKYKDIEAGIKLVKGNIGFNEGIYTFPLFCTFLLKEFIRNTNRKDLE